MIFHEIYSAYYKTVAAILKEAASRRVTAEEMREIAKKNAFGESFLTVEESLTTGNWPLLDENGRSILKKVPEIPLTLTEKRWLKAISLDPRIRLFGEPIPDFPDVEPLFRPGDVCVFDRYGDGDDYADEGYVFRFRLILDAIRERFPLKFNVINRKGGVNYLTAQPETLEYSEKDDKFRVITTGCRYGNVINLGRIVSCKRAEGGIPTASRRNREQTRQVVMEVTDERNALERVMLHFAHFSKEAERLDGNVYRLRVDYDPDDETEMVIRVLSFGPLVRVIAPDSFVGLIKERLKQQKSCGLF